MPDDLVVAHPVTGELLDNLDSQPPAVLAEALFELRARKARMRTSERALEAELRRRVELRERAVHIVGDYEISAKPESRREWDADELEGVLRELLDRGVVHAGELTEVIRHETFVSASEALRLLNRLSGDARTAVERCYRWQKKPGRLIVERSVDLLPREASA